MQGMKTFLINKSKYFSVATAFNRVPFSTEFAFIANSVFFIKEV